jgi:hypothetical protein
VSRTGRQLIDVLGREDKLAVWKDGDRVQKLTGFSQNYVNLDLLLSDLGTPDFSETRSIKGHRSGHKDDHTQMINLLDW